MSSPPVAIPAGHLPPSSRYRHPGDVIRLISAGLLLAGALAASVTVVAAVIALVPPGRARAAWGAAAAGFSVLMALSRAYLGAHWLSDAIAGVLLGTSCALLAALAVDGLQRRRNADQPGAHPPVPADRR